MMLHPGCRIRVHFYLKVKTKTTHRIHQSDTLDFAILGCSRTKLSEINEAFCCLWGCRCRTSCVLSSRCCKSLVLTVQFVLQMAAEGTDCAVLSSFLCTSVTADFRRHHDAAASDITLHFAVSMKSDVSCHIHPGKLTDGSLRHRSRHVLRAN